MTVVATRRPRVQAGRSLAWPVMAADRGSGRCPGVPGRRAEQLRAAVVGIVAVGAVLLPLGRDLGEDSLPLSNYPMFTARRAQVTSIERAIGIAADGSEHVLGPELTGGTVEVIHAAQTIVDAIRAGSAGELCAEIAGRVSNSGDDHTTEIVVVTERFDIIAGLQRDDPEAAERSVHARCEVAR